MIKRAIFTLFFPLLLSAALPKDTEVRTGKLPNGLTYYIRKNDFPQDRACARLVVNVGYFDGTDEEVGIAHFVEHLTLRQTENFADHEIWKFLDSIGAPLGADANAYTSDSQTVYLADLPLEIEGVLDQELTILSEIAHRAKFTDEIVNKERGVVLQELRERNDHVQRFREEYIHWLTDGAYVYSDSAACVEAATAATLEDFYKRYYRPERMAIVVVGAIDPDEVEEKIIEKFSFPASKGCSPKLHQGRVESKGGQFFSYHHPEVEQNICCLGTLIPAIHVESDKTLKTTTSLQLFYHMLREHFSHLAEKEGAAVLGGGAYKMPLFHKSQNEIGIGFAYFEGREEEALEQVYSLFQSAIYGKQDEELFAQGVQILCDQIDEFLKNRHRIYNAQFVEEYCAAFDNNIQPIDLVQLLEMKKELLENISLKEVSAEVQKLFAGREFWLRHFGKEALDEKPLLATLRQVWKGADLEGIEQKELTITPEEMGEIAVDSFHLCNGLRVVLKPTNFQEDRVEIYGFAKGGMASLECPELIEASKIATQYQIQAGFGGLTRQEIDRYLNKNHVDFSISLDDNMRFFSGSSIRGNHAPLFQMIHALFMYRNEDAKAFEKVKALCQEEAQLQSNSPKTQFGNAVCAQNYQNHALFAPLDLDQVTQENCDYLLTQAYGNPCEYTLIIVGDFDEQEMKTLIKQYVATLPLKKLFQSFPSVANFPHPEGVVQETFYAGEEKFATTQVSIQLPNDFRRGKSLSFFVKNLVEKALNEKFRNELGVSYHPSVKISKPLYPLSSDLRLKIKICTDAKEGPRHVSILEDVRAQLFATPPTFEQIEGLKKELRSGNKRDFETERGWISHLKHSLLYDGNFCDMGDLSYLDEVTPEMVHTEIQKALSSQNISILTWLPAAYEGER